MTAAPTTGPRTAGALAAKCIAEGADLILAAGGDGTINEAVQGMAGTNVPLGILPAGTANVLANELGVARRAEQAAGEISSMVARRVGLGRLHTDEDRWFLMMAGIGLDAHIVYNLNLDWKSRLGKGAYWLAGAQAVGRRLAPFEVEANGLRFPSTFTLVSRVRNYGGDFRIAPTATLVDDSFEVVLFQSASSTGYLPYLWGMFRNRLARMRGVTILRTRELKLAAAADPHVHIEVDGEYVGRLPARIELVPGALTLLMPPQYPQ